MYAYGGFAPKCMLIIRQRRARWQWRESKTPAPVELLAIIARVLDEQPIEGSTYSMTGIDPRKSHPIRRQPRLVEEISLIMGLPMLWNARSSIPDLSAAYDSVIRASRTHGEGERSGRVVKLR